MIEFAALTYGMVLSFVFASLHGNAKRQQKNPPIMILVGYFLVGVTALLSAVLFGF
jgi:RsiW-degrading membrane proteinase PrsW (M82 family)